jgi:hypothetical protein
MSYKVKESGDIFQVVDAQTEEVKAEKSTREEAEDLVDALNRMEKDLEDKVE